MSLLSELWFQRVTELTNKTGVAENTLSSVEAEVKRLKDGGQAELLYGKLKRLIREYGYQCATVSTLGLPDSYENRYYAEKELIAVLEELAKLAGVDVSEKPKEASKSKNKR